VLLLGVAGCGTWHLEQLLDVQPGRPWVVASKTSLYQGFRFQDGGKGGRVLVTFQDGAGRFTVPARYTVEQDPKAGNTPRGWIEVRYEADEALRARYRQAAKTLKATANPGDEILKVADELPEAQRFGAQESRGRNGLALADDWGYTLELVRGDYEAGDLLDLQPGTPWLSGSGLYAAFVFMGGRQGGEAVITFHDGAQEFDVPARYTVQDAAPGAAGGSVEVRYEADEALRARYRQAVKRLKAAAPQGNEALKIPDELPAVQRFRPGEGGEGLILTTEEGYTIRLARAPR
jgi:hypothetical protein